MRLKRGLKMTKKKLAPEMHKFQSDLLQSMREFKTGKYARVTQVQPLSAAQARACVGLSQEQFARLLDIPVRTLQEREQGRREPTGAARTLLRVAVHSPEALLSLL